MSKSVIAFASDHGALELKGALKAHAESLGFSVLELGTEGPESVDYPVGGFGPVV